MDPLSEKGKRWSPCTYAFDNPIMFIDPDGREANTPTPKEAAIMAKHVYGDKIKLIGGWEVFKKKFDNIILNNSDNGFKSQIYERTVKGKTEYTYVTAGTDTDSGKDIFQDLAQPIGFSGQYQLSVNNAKEISNQLGSSELTYVGHSLGGGEASLNSLATNRKAITFNAAGVGDITKMLHVTTSFNSEKKYRCLYNEE